MRDSKYKKIERIWSTEKEKREKVKGEGKKKLEGEKRRDRAEEAAPGEVELSERARPRAPRLIPLL